MANTTEICNLALFRVGAETITDIYENSRPAEVCRLFFPIARDSILRDHDWGFARFEANLAELSETASGYDYVYLYPSDCIKIRKLYNASEAYIGDDIPITMGVDSTKNNRTILTNVSQAKAIYTARIENSTLFDAMFVDALAWRLASDLCEPLRTDSQKGARFLEIYQRMISSSAMEDSHEDKIKPEITSSLERSRS